LVYRFGACEIAIVGRPPRQDLRDADPCLVRPDTRDSWHIRIDLAPGRFDEAIDRKSDQPHHHQNHSTGRQILQRIECVLHAGRIHRLISRTADDQEQGDLHKHHAAGDQTEPRHRTHIAHNVFVSFKVLFKRDHPAF
jgi:hypothetical protein